jgi:hypothetical protein
MKTSTATICWLMIAAIGTMILFGWVRTGYIALGSSSGTGLNNCNAWTTSLSSLSGTAASL